MTAEVEFMEFYSWWLSSGDSVLDMAKKREQARLKMWSKQSPLVTDYTGKSDVTRGVLSQKTGALRSSEIPDGHVTALRGCSTLFVDVYLLLPLCLFASLPSASLPIPPSPSLSLSPSCALV